MIEDRYASANQFDFARPPGFGEEWFDWAVEAQDREPAFCRTSLNPVAPLDASRLGRTEGATKARCPLGVKNGREALKMRCPLFS
jgi:hypothetical protein